MTFSVPQERKLVTELPGPKSVALQERRVKSVSRGAGTLANIYMDPAREPSWSTSTATS